MSAESAGVLDRFVSAERRELWQRSWKRFTSRPMSVIGLGIIIAIILLAVFAPVVAPYPEHAGKFTDFSNTLQPPSLDHPLGTDHVGRDVLSRILFGYRLSLMLVGVVLGFGVPVGVLLGLVAGYYGGWVETIIMRATDTALALPPLVMALAITSALEPTLTNAMIAIAALWWTWHARLVQSIVASERGEEYVQAAKLAGASTPHILFREILPNTLSPILVKVTLDAGFVILIGAGLSFIGVGVQPPQPGLGTMVSQGTSYLPDSWWVSVFAGLAIFVLVMGFNMLGDGLRDLFDVEVNR
ncbi:ABC transporter permease [Haloferax sp. Atlit-10N]|uniref:ABC-type dipeptide/oligopeptide/nickel transport system, permease protein II n=1 Tax=Haloferax prahovense (strain DSM 18310 / JCM 13924 / TL6) TaxID=1227461 RepID=M0FXS7_HALPT|nr:MULTISPECIES: ABC transporter permease [Haloferax]ELZ64037.1 ABC-type dipeptide/oligopeptide/nickel transport system, permease protein II [Haloferax prahovense DSM 18310]MCO8265216.1 ABC transporter permease [Haloferax sp. AB510]RDZ40019.1 ABC transporter permease [Haloferax sp. Atlit-19N]RDZ40300.1 ABC transporter permease [Haloferax sp. Atlit-16N]RDZ56773.1 ABC transporter permease [Haloferax sp. Atlit-10N]